MADIELAIKIPKEVYEHILKAKSVPDVLGIDIVNTINAVKSGIPLPEGHGKIIDEGQITKCEQTGLIMKDGKTTRCFTTDAPTIINTDYAGLEKRQLGSSENKTGIYADDYDAPKTVSMT